MLAPQPLQEEVDRTQPGQSRYIARFTEHVGIGLTVPKLCKWLQQDGFVYTAGGVLLACHLHVRGG